MTTLVSAFISNCNDNRSFEKYLEYGKELLVIDQNKIIFLEKEVYILLKEYENSKTIILPFEKSALLFTKEGQSNNIELPSHRNKCKDTIEYLLVQNNKTEWVSRAIEMNPFHSNQFIWVDFGIYHIYNDRFLFKNIMNKMCSCYYNKVRIAHIWNMNSIVGDEFNKPLWYFAGGIFGGSVSALSKFIRLAKKYLGKMIEDRKLCWEVNIWYSIYKENKELFDVYSSDHNKTMLDRYVGNDDNDMRKVWDNIDKIIYINLDRRIDRREQIENEFIKMGIPVEKVYRLSAVNNIQRSEVGCCSSHIQALEFAKSNNYNNVLILEDDFEFVLSREKVKQTLTTFFDSQIEYDVIMFSYNLNKYEPMNSLLGKVLYAQTASGYLVNGKFIDRMLENWKEGLNKLVSTGIHWHYAADVYWKHIQCVSKWYYFIDRIGKQRKSYSDLAHKYTDYGC